MDTKKKKAPIAANNQGGMFKTSSPEYRTCATGFHPVFTVFSSTYDKGQGGESC